MLRIIRNALLVLAGLLVLPAHAAVTQPQIDLTAVTNAHYHVHHLIGNGLASPNNLHAQQQDIESSLQILEAVELTRSVAAQYRLSITKIEVGVQYFEQARRASGRKRSDLVELGNQAMRAAKALLDLAVKIFNEVQPQLVAFFEARGKPVKPPKWPIELKGEFRDCIPGQSDPECCDDNYAAGLAALDKIKKYLTGREYQAILDCLKRVHTRCVRLYEKNNILFNKEYWESCFEGYVIFKYPRGG